MMGSLFCICFVFCPFNYPSVGKKKTGFAAASCWCQGIPVIFPPALPSGGGHRGEVPFYVYCLSRPKGRTTKSCPQPTNPNLEMSCAAGESHNWSLNEISVWIVSTVVIGLGSDCSSGQYSIAQSMFVVGFVGGWFGLVVFFFFRGQEKCNLGQMKTWC